jgi:ligand-binding SRPBCC domain-containing protein
MTAPAPLAEVFRLFEDPRNLAKITPPWLNFQVIDPDRIRMRAGAEINYVIRWLGLPVKWKTIIRRYDPPRIFVDEQARGPYRLWHHEHTFEETAAGVVIRDRVDYRLPLGPLGRVAHAVIVKRQLLEIFRYRQAAIAKMLAVPGIRFDEPAIRVAGE